MSDKRLNNTIFLMFLATENYKRAHAVPRHFEVAAYCKITANYFLYFTDDTYKSVLFTTACSFLFYQSNRLDKGGVPGVREAQGRNRLCSRLD